jgi:Aspartyl/Asparaginyl beta-hydroxylase
VSGLPGAMPLLRSYDANRMAAEARALHDGQWRAQRAYGPNGVFGEAEIDWRILPLRGPGGDPNRTDPGGAGLVGYADTPYLDKAPYFAEILAAIPAPLRSVRLMALGPRVQVPEHRDGKCGFPWGVTRLHVPVITNPGAEVVIDRQSTHWDAGRLWFGDFNRPHYVRNAGDEPRIHLVIDVMVTLELLKLLPREHLDELPWADVLIAREAVPLRPADLSGLRCTIPIPAEFPQWSEDEYESGPDLDGAIEILDGRPVLLVAGEPTFALVHVGLGEFRFEGWTEERTLHLDLSRPDPQVRFRIRTGHRLNEWIRQARVAEGSGR